MNYLNNPITDYWLKYYLDREIGLCMLCGNTGTIDLTNVKDPQGHSLNVGYTTYCICPNGQSLRHIRGDE